MSLGQWMFVRFTGCHSPCWVARLEKHGKSLDLNFILDINHFSGSVRNQQQQNNKDFFFLKESVLAFLSVLAHT